MSDLRTDRDVEQTLTAWMDHVAPTRPPTRLLEGTFAETMRTRQAAVVPVAPRRSGSGRLGGRPRSAGP